MAKTRYNRVNKVESMFEILDERAQMMIFQGRYDKAIHALESIEDKSLSKVMIKAFEDEDVDFVFELLSAQLDISDNQKCLDIYYSIKGFVNIKSRLEKVWQKREREERNEG